ncbi:MAG TPA: hypothetical protein PLU22_08350, partial [Polyangiaceae bacterium]|nr:hypothetical protein [Polyangiaceae bacterium]
LIFWAVVLGGSALSVTGFYLLMPFAFGMTIHDMQYFVVVHSAVALVLGADGSRRGRRGEAAVTIEGAVHAGGAALGLRGRF